MYFLLFSLFSCSWQCKVHCYLCYLPWGVGTAYSLVALQYFSRGRIKELILYQRISQCCFDCQFCVLFLSTKEALVEYKVMTTLQSLDLEPQQWPFMTLPSLNQPIFVSPFIANVDFHLQPQAELVEFVVSKTKQDRSAYKNILKVVFILKKCLRSNLTL